MIRCLLIGLVVNQVLASEQGSVEGSLGRLLSTYYLEPESRDQIYSLIATSSESLKPALQKNKHRSKVLVPLAQGTGMAWFWLSMARYFRGRAPMHTGERESARCGDVVTNAVALTEKPKTFSEVSGFHFGEALLYGGVPWTLLLMYLHRGEPWFDPMDLLKLVQRHALLRLEMETASLRNALVDSQKEQKSNLLQKVSILAKQLDHFSQTAPELYQATPLEPFDQQPPAFTEVEAASLSFKGTAELMQRNLLEAHKMIGLREDRTIFVSIPPITETLQRIRAALKD